MESQALSPMTLSTAKQVPKGARKAPAEASPSQGQTRGPSEPLALQPARPLPPGMEECSTDIGCEGGDPKPGMEGDDYQRLLDIIAFLMKRSSQPEQSSFKDFTSRVLQAAVSPERRMSFLFRPNEATQGLQPSAETSPSSSISFETVGEGEDAQMLIRNDETGEIVGALRHDEIQAIRERMENAQGGSGLFVREKA